MFMHIKRNKLLLHGPKHEWIDIKHINHKEKTRISNRYPKKSMFNRILITQKKKINILSKRYQTYNNHKKKSLYMLHRVYRPDDYKKKQLNIEIYKEIYVITNKII